MSPLNLLPPILFSLLLSHTLSQTTFSFIGHVSHGINSYNNRRIVDFQAHSNIFSSFPPIHEIGVLNTRPGAKNASRIFQSTPLDSIMANINAYDFQKNLGLPPGVGPWNLPLAQVPTIHIPSADLNDRTTPGLFQDSKQPEMVGTPYLSKDADSEITLRDWNRVVAKLEGKCFKSGRAMVRVTLKNGLPNALYTLWDVGVTDPLTDMEAPNVGPFGGLPNVIATGRKGKGSIVRRLNYCPSDKCRGRKRCILYIAAVYHYDHMIYAGAPAMDVGGQTGGQVAGSQVQIFINADKLIEPQNEF